MKCIITIENSILPIYIPNITHLSIPGEDRFIVQSKSDFINAYQMFNIYDRWGRVLYSAPRGTSGHSYLLYRSGMLDNKVYQFEGDVSVALYFSFQYVLTKVFAQRK